MESNFSGMRLRNGKVILGDGDLRIVNSDGLQGGSYIPAHVGSSDESIAISHDTRVLELEKELRKANLRILSLEDHIEQMSIRSNRSSRASLRSESRQGSHFGSVPSSAEWFYTQTSEHLVVRPILAECSSPDESLSSATDFSTSGLSSAARPNTSGRLGFSSFVGTPCNQGTRVSVACSSAVHDSRGDVPPRSEGTTPFDK
ncbi:hypothetical protein GE061_007290 [Apolygus lucorum]|uniref:Uncharacterized protein n=1 Tax=Apolygus lucorum TaxID=248454 RepID=A0A6A4IRB8_APOLU|nr:hypothetical protein GE061_007290 [Apolygus lucorum]